MPRLAPARLLVGAILCLSAGACTTIPKVLYHEYPLDDRLVQYYAQQSTSDPNTHHFFMRVCNLTALGELTSCKDSLILENVHPSTL